MVCAECGAEYWAEKTCCNRSEANRWEAWMQGQEGCCRECYAKRMAAERAADREAENAAAAARAAELNLPALEGSEKQVAWATTIRQEALDSALRAAAGADTAALNADGRAFVAGVVARMSVEARWWIDRRDDVAHLIREEIECANWARIDDAARAAKMAEVRATAERNLPGAAGACAKAELASYERYERARLAGGRTSMAQREADDAAKRASLPPVPAKLADRLGRSGARWNGKFYGRNGLRVYLDGQEVQVPADVKAAWDREWTAYRAAKQAAGL